MKYAASIAMAATALWLSGCASAPTIAVVDPVGPAPTVGTAGSGEGSLLVYSARTPALVDVNLEEWRLNNDFGRNEFMSAPSHSGYTIYGRNGEVVERVGNARGMGDQMPSVVKLPAGAYKVEAQALNCDGNRVPVIIPVVIKAGQTTVAHLEGGWHPAGFSNTEVAKLPCGRPIGWRASEGELLSSATPAN